MKIIQSLLFCLLLFTLKGGGRMAFVSLCVSLIMAKRRTFEQVPTRYQSDVQADLLALGLDTNGDVIQSAE